MLLLLLLLLLLRRIHGKIMCDVLLIRRSPSKNEAEELSTVTYGRPLESRGDPALQVSMVDISVLARLC